MRDLSNLDFHEVIGQATPTVVDFHAEWCTPCKRMEPILEELDQELEGVDFARLNVDDFVEIASQYSVMSIPCLIVFENGEVVDRFTGARSKNIFKDLLEEALQK